MALAGMQHPPSVLGARTAPRARRNAVAVGQKCQGMTDASRYLVGEREEERARAQHHENDPSPTLCPGRILASRGEAHRGRTAGRVRTNRLRRLGDGGHTARRNSPSRWIRARGGGRVTRGARGARRQRACGPARRGGTGRGPSVRLVPFFLHQVSPKKNPNSKFLGSQGEKSMKNPRK